ncbi:MAG: helix-turn-helix domain-containing protein [Flavobacteriales bacterium]
MRIVIKQSSSLKDIYTYLHEKLNGEPLYKYGFTFKKEKANGYLKYYTIYKGVEVLVMDANFKEDCLIHFLLKNKEKSYLLHFSNKPNIVLDTESETTLNDIAHFHLFDNFKATIKKELPAQCILINLSHKFIMDYPERDWPYIYKILNDHSPDIKLKYNHKIKNYIKRVFLAQKFHFGITTISMINIFKLCNEFFYMIYRNEKQKDNKRMLSAHDIVELNRIYDEMVEKCENPPHLTKMAKKYGMSSSNLKKKFTIHFGVPYAKASFKLKMERAKELLIEGYNVTEVSNKLQYSQVSKFTQSFKKFHSILPSSLKSESKNLSKFEIKKEV